jgi:hypothetical protein
MARNYWPLLALAAGAFAGCSKRAPAPPEQQTYAEALTAYNTEVAALDAVEQEVDKERTQQKRSQAEFRRLAEANRAAATAGKAHATLDEQEATDKTAADFKQLDGETQQKNYARLHEKSAQLDLQKSRVAAAKTARDAAYERERTR